MRPHGPNSSIINQTSLHPNRVKTKPLQYRETSSSPQTFQVQNAAHERKTNLQHHGTS